MKTPLCFAACVVLFASGLPAADPPPALTEAEFLTLLKEQVGEMPAGWGSLEALSFDPTGKKGLPGVSVAIYYSDPPTGYPQVKDDTKRLVVASHEVLKSKGIDPKEKTVFIHGRARKREKSDTGEDAVRMYGVSVYSPFSGAIEFEKNK
jgi:hypothetical protein